MNSLSGGARHLRDPFTPLFRAVEAERDRHLCGGLGKGPLYTERIGDRVFMKLSTDLKTVPTPIQSLPSNSRSVADES